MITCTKCGEQSPDDTRFCPRCNKKLQSAFQAATPETPTDTPLGAFKHKGVSADQWKSLKRMLEAWGYVLVLAAVATGCFLTRTWWPIYPTVAVLGLLAWLRRV